MKTVSITFVGDGSDRVAQKFYTWMIDGGLEDQMIQTLSDDATEVEGIVDHDNDALALAVGSSFMSERG